jgi:hypothetical protein
MARRPTAHDGTKLERRKAQRFGVNIPLEAAWLGPDGAPMKEEALAKQVNAGGGFLEMAAYPEVGARVTLTNFFSAETAEARVLATATSREGVANGIIVEMVVPSESFWGVNLQLKKTSIELQRLEKALRSGGIDLRLLKEFRDAVDHLHALAASVQQFRERQAQGEEDASGSPIVSERIRRATNLCLEVITDLDSGKVSEETKGVSELAETLEQARQRLNILLSRYRPALGRR